MRRPELIKMRRSHRPKRTWQHQRQPRTDRINNCLFTQTRKVSRTVAQLARENFVACQLQLHAGMRRLAPTDQLAICFGGAAMKASRSMRVRMLKTSCFVFHTGCDTLAEAAPALAASARCSVVTSTNGALSSRRDS